MGMDTHGVGQTSDDMNAMLALAKNRKDYREQKGILIEERMLKFRPLK